MESKYRELWWGIGLGILGYCAAYAIHQQLLAVRTISEIPDNEKGPEQPSADDIKLDTLERLIPNVNREISSAATNIVAERAAKGLTYELLLRCIIGNDTEKRNRSLTTLRYLHERVSNDVLKPHFGTFVAVVDCLCTKAMMDEAMSYEEQLEKKAIVYRSQQYNDTIRLLRQIIADANHGIQGNRDGLSTATRAGLVSRWLARYPWGGRDQSERDKRIVFCNRVESSSSDALMQWVLLKLVDDYERYSGQDDSGLKLLQVHGLVDEEFVRKYDHPEWRFHHDEDGGFKRDEDSDRGSDSGFPENAPGPPQRRDESPEERQLRRRRREAMVIGGDGVPYALASTVRRTTDVPEEIGDTQGVDPEAERATIQEVINEVRQVAESPSSPEAGVDP